MNETDHQLNLLSTYGGKPPFQAHSETSREAAERIVSKVVRDRHRVLQLIRSRGLYGATDQETQQALDMRGSTERPRRCELVEGGFVVDSGKKRKTRSGRLAVVWVISHPTQRRLTPTKEVAA